MDRFFNMDNKFFSMMSKVADLILLNLLCIVCSIPIITAGASITAMFYVTLKMVRNEDPYIWKNFWKSFRQNFKQGTLVWILTLLVCTFLGMDFYIINSQDSTMFAVIRVLLWIICVILLSMFLYVFPIISHFVCSTRQAIKNALLMSIGHLPYTAVLLLVCGGIVYLCAISANAFAITIVLSGICGFSVMSFSACLLFNRIFKKYEPEETVTEEMIPEEL